MVLGELSRKLIFHSTSSLSCPHRSNLVTLRFPHQKSISEVQWQAEPPTPPRYQTLGSEPHLVSTLPSLCTQVGDAPWRAKPPCPPGVSEEVWGGDSWHSPIFLPSGVRDARQGAELPPYSAATKQLSQPPALPLPGVSKAQSYTTWRQRVSRSWCPTFTRKAPLRPGRELNFHPIRLQGSSVSQLSTFGTGKAH